MAHAASGQYLPDSNIYTEKRYRLITLVGFGLTCSRPIQSRGYCCSPRLRPGTGTLWQVEVPDRLEYLDHHHKRLCLIQHLLALYFCWEYPVTATLSKDQFLTDFREGRSRYCSSILVNALLALGCRFSSKSFTRTVPNVMHTSGDHFFEECQRLLSLEEDHRALTTIQALGIMSIREASCGRDLTSSYYGDQSIRLAMEMDQPGEASSDADKLAVRSATFWGAFALDKYGSCSTKASRSYRPLPL